MALSTFPLVLTKYINPSTKMKPVAENTRTHGGRCLTSYVTSVTLCDGVSDQQILNSAGQKVTIYSILVNATSCLYTLVQLFSSQWLMVNLVLTGYFSWITEMQRRVTRLAMLNEIVPLAVIINPMNK